ncbi:RidA family protein [Kordiimonas pumila]|uniref:RidA family protein n=1 Tax=Kordiimonas pumila TaxID=2161677 RepID=A0ABV7D1E9_9PROT|nr:RidA family protein [Kordiimonas pumila]
MTHMHLLPDGWKQPIGYSNGMVASGTMIFLGGQIGWNENQVFEAQTFAEQFEQTLNNIAVLLSEAGAAPKDLVRLTWFITDKSEYLANLKEIGRIYRSIFGAHYPAMSVVQVADLIEDAAKIEIEATAVIKGDF